MRRCYLAVLCLPLVASGTTPLAVVEEPQSVEQMVLSLDHALQSADAALMLELHWTPAWDALDPEEVAEAKVEALASMDSDRLRAAQKAGDLPLSLQLVTVEYTGEDSADVVLLFSLSGGRTEEETREAVWREGGWRLLSDHI